MEDKSVENTKTKAMKAKRIKIEKKHKNIRDIVKRYNMHGLGSQEERRESEGEEIIEQTLVKKFPKPTKH